MPVCGCDGNMYPNSCVADCADVAWTPAVSNGMPGGFLPCTQPSPFACMGGAAPGITICVGPGNYAMGQANVMAVYSTMAACIADSCTVTPPPPPPPCTVEINNGTVDIEICDGDTTILEATTGFDTYLWTVASTGATLGTTHIIEVTDPGLYIVIVTDSTNCVDMDSIEVIVFQSPPLSIVSFPSPPEICWGDSITLMASPGFWLYQWNTGPPMQVNYQILSDQPSQDTWYMVEAEDSNGCAVREDIWVYVDTCVTGTNSEIFSKINIYPNPTSDKLYIDLPHNEIFTISVLSMEGKLILQKIEVLNSIVIASKKLIKGSYILRIENDKGTFNQIVIFE